MNLRSKLEYLRDNQFNSENFHTISWMDYETVTYAENFRKYFLEKHNINLELLFIVLIGCDFMAQLMDCSSCPVTEHWFEDFNEYLINLELYPTKI